jgi:hypothetical protein
LVLDRRKLHHNRYSTTVLGISQNCKKWL